MLTARTMRARSWRVSLHWRLRRAMCWKKYTQLYEAKEEWRYTREAIKRSLEASRSSAFSARRKMNLEKEPAKAA